MDYITIPGVSVPYKLDSLSSINFEGMMPIRNIRELSPRQAGTRIVSTFYEERSGSLVLNVPKDDKHAIANLFSPDRHNIGGGSVFIYHKELEGGKIYKGNDGTILAGTGYVFSPTGRFVDRGGLVAGSFIEVDGINVQVLQHYSDSVLLVNHTFLEDNTNVMWKYTSGAVYRELEFYIDDGLAFFRTGNMNTYTQEVIDIIAGNPFWLGYQQQIYWSDVVIRENKSYPMTYPENELYDLTVPVTDISNTMTGDVAVKPTIRIDGAMETFKISNLTQNTYIGYDNVVLINEYIIIDLQNATAISYPSEISVLHLVEGDLTTFTLLPFVVNELKILRESVTTSSSITVSWRNRYLVS